MKNNYNIIISKINEELTNKNLNITRLEELIKELKTTKDQCTFCYINYDLIKKTMTSWNLETHKKILFKGQFKKLKYEFMQKLYEILDQKTKEKLIEKDLEDKKIIIEPPLKTSITNFKINKKEIITTEYIIKTNEEYAISLRKKENIYIFNIYLPDTLDFLLKNRGIIKSIYERGCTLETKDKKIEMMPYKFIQLNETTYKDSINFKFIISDAGKLLSNEVKKTKIKIDKIQSPEELNKNIIYKEFIEKIKNELKIETPINNINQITEIILNYFVGYNASFAIYKNNGIYTTKRKKFYTESIKPMSKFASDINLLFYLSQLEKIECPDKYLYKVIDNIDEIINHLNERNLLNEYIKNNPEIIKKYIKNN